MWGFKGKWGGGRRGWLRPWILAIIGRGPKNGAEIMDEIEKFTWGGWRPSPGSVYPLLDEMAVEGLIKKRSEDGKYEITQKGKDETEWPFGMPFHEKASTVDSVLDEMGSYASYLEDLARSDAAKLAQSKGKLKEISERLSRLSA